MNSARPIDAWCKKVAALEKMMSHCAAEYSEVVETYEEMRNMTSDLNREAGDDAKERIDNGFSAAFETHKRLCAVRAGGLTRRRRQTRRGATRRG